MNLWTSFAANGIPDGYKDVVWEPVAGGGDPNQMGSLRCLNISDTVEMIKPPENERMTFWKTIY